MESIPLHPTRGLDPHLTFCPRCGKEGSNLAIGRIQVAHTHGEPDEIITCWSYGTGAQVKAALDAAGIYNYDTREAREGERLPDIEPCDACQTEITRHRDLVAAGGVHFRCTQCNRHGVIKGDSDFAQEVRAAHKLPAPDPMGVEFANCNQHWAGE